jgi:hypothetical protein
MANSVGCVFGVSGTCRQYFAGRGRKRAMALSAGECACLCGAERSCAPPPRRECTCAASTPAGRGTAHTPPLAAMILSPIPAPKHHDVNAIQAKLESTSVARRCARAPLRVLFGMYTCSAGLTHPGTASVRGAFVSRTGVVRRWKRYSAEVHAQARFTKSMFTRLRLRAK